nr:transposase (putative), gypsy type [Tanacetum cinerariifolium]
MVGSHALCGKCRLDTLNACQDVVDHIVPPGYFSELRHMPNAEFLSQYNKILVQQVAMSSQLRLCFEQEVRLLKKARAQIARWDQRIQVREEEIKKLDQEVQGLQNQTSNLKTLLEAEADMKKAAEAKNADLTKELESLRTQFLDLQVSNDQLTQQVLTLQTQVTGEEQIRAAFEEFKKYKDDKVEKRCTEKDAHLDALSIDFDEELYPHMLTAIAGRRWVIRHGLRLSVMKYAESIELRQAFANVVSVGIAKGMSEGLVHGIEHGKASRDLEVVEAYDTEANNKYPQALQELKDLKYPIVDQLEGVKDDLMEVIMASLHLESDSGEDAPKWIRDLRPSTSQLKIHVYPEKKRCRVVCRTHGVGSAHHARFDSVPVSVSIVAPQGLAILLVEAATQTETSEDDASLRFLRSKSLPPMYNLTGHSTACGVFSYAPNVLDVRQVKTQDPWPLRLQPSYAAGPL